MESQFIAAHKFSSLHRQALEKDSKCGCFFCLNIFSPSDIIEWCDQEDTAICPHCGIDSVIGQSSGFPITEMFLKGMNKLWF